jgi:hypothetical protein
MLDLVWVMVEIPTKTASEKGTLKAKAQHLAVLANMSKS